MMLYMHDREARKNYFCPPFCLQLLLSQQRAESSNDPYQILPLNLTKSSKVYSNKYGGPEVHTF